MTPFGELPPDTSNATEGVVKRWAARDKMAAVDALLDALQI